MENIEKMKVYSIKRYKITNELRKAIKNGKYSITNLCRILGFNVKNIYYKNISINEEHLNKLNSVLGKSLNLEEIKFDFTKNLGRRYTPSKPIKLPKKSEKLAEFVGIMLGDGNIYKNQIKIAFDKRNKKYIRYVEKLFKELFKVKMGKHILEKTNNAYLYYYNQYLVKELLRLGLKRGNKIKNQLGVQNWIKENPNYAKGCIRGLIDTDGCIYFCKRDRKTYIKFTNFNQRLLDDFKEITKDLGYSFAKANKRNACLYRKDQVAKFIKDVKPLKSII